MERSYGNNIDLECQKRKVVRNMTKFRTDKMYRISGIDLGMLIVAETKEDVNEVIERCIARGPIDGEVAYKMIVSEPEELKSE